MRRQLFVLGVAALVLAFTGCVSGMRDERSARDSVAVQVQPPTAIDTARPRHIPVPDTIRGPTQRSPSESTPQQPGGADSVPLMAVAELVAASGPVSGRVRVRGTCIGYSRVMALGPQPRTRSDWQLTADGLAIWVVGPYPPGCSGTTPSLAPSTLIVEVTVDTLPALGARPSRARRYLVRVQ